jgi:hypothetical protein
MMDEFIHWPKPYLVVSSTCDEIFSWMIEIWMKNHLVTEETYNPQINLQGMTNNDGLTFNVGDMVHSRLGYYFWDKGLKDYVALDLGVYHDLLLFDQ